MRIVTDLVILLAVAALLGWSAIRLWRISSSLLRWVLVSLAVLASTACFALSILAIAGLDRLYARSAPIPNLKVAGAPGEILRGGEIVRSFCDTCHSQTGPLTGGRDIGKGFPIPIGSFVSANLTPAGSLGRWSDGEIFRAIRNGVDADGHWLTIMSYTNAGSLSDDDIRSLIAYLRTRKPAGTATVNPPDRFSLLGVVLLGVGMLPPGKPVFTGVITAPPKSATVQYGSYVVSYQDCRECHGADLAGGVPGQLGPIGPDLNLVKSWNLAQFIATMRTGTDPGGHQLREQMPWRWIGKMDDDELGALYEYLTQLPGSRSTATK